ncbi:MAG: aminomethyltransferase [Halieaceae bacterium]|jgi:aminomethyltransferase
MSLKHTPMDALHRELGARMVPFAGYDMPVQYREGILAEHAHTREHAGLFDVSHMGQLVLEGADVTATLEALVPADLVSLGENRQTYALLTNESGGVRDDLIITRWGPECLFLVVNAGCKAEDRAHIEAHLAPGQTLRELEGQGLLALQGPGAREVLVGLIPQTAELTFLQGGHFRLDAMDLYITCSGYTGEDGFELSVGAQHTEALARRLLSHPRAAPVGLGARDSLRLEAGLCLYGHELSPTITPVEARLSWAIGKARRPGGERAGGYPGAECIGAQLASGAAVARVGLRVLGKRPVREGQSVHNADGETIGVVTSGGFGATVAAPIAMALIDSAYAAVGTDLLVNVRGTAMPVQTAKMPMVTPGYFRG